MFEIRMLPRHRVIRAGLLATLLLALAVPSIARKHARAKPRPPAKAKWTLVWSDEFNGPDGSAPDPAKWTYDIGVDGNGWGNQELEYYTKSPQNVLIQGGNLVITARHETFTGPNPAPDKNDAAAGGTPSATVTRDYTSARLKSEGLFAQAYGRIEARIKIPRGQGMWPAFWMLGDDIAKAGWPACGEIDIMENIGKEPFAVHGSLHGPGPGNAGTDDMTRVYTLRRERFADAFHVFAVEWEPREIRFYVDSHLYFTAQPREMPHGTGWVFNHPFFILLNLAVGGSWPGNPDSSTGFPQQMLVDYVRVYSQSPAP